MTKYLVTGSAGFIGFHVAKALLERGEEVIGIDNLNNYYNVKLKEDRNVILNSYSNFAFHKADLVVRNELFNILDKAQPNLICHLAAQAGIRYSFENPYAYEWSNIQGFLNLIEWSKQRADNFVYASSSSVYGGNKEIPFSEYHRVDYPVSLYGATKKSNELMAHTYHHLFALPVTGLRFFTVYGPWGRPDMAYYKFALKMIHNEPIEVYGHGKMKRDFTYIDDIVPSILRVLDNPKEYEIYNLGGHRPVELLYFISLLETELGVETKKELLPMQPGEVPVTYANIEKARRELGFMPSISIEEGIKRFAKWFKEYHYSHKYHYALPWAKD